MRRLCIIILVLLIPVLLCGTVLAQEKKVEPGSLQKTCFIMKGNPVNPEIYADYKGHRIYFCCNDCLAAFKADPERYYQEMLKAKMPMEKTPQPQK
jgi:YHS domain-containing protein